MKRIKLDNTIENRTLQQQNNEVFIRQSESPCNREDQTMPNSMIIKNDEGEIEKLGPLFHAVRSGDCETLYLHFEKAKATKNVREYIEFLNFCTILLHIAAENGHVTCVEILLDNGVHVNDKDKFNCTPLHQAAKNGHYSCVRRLLLAGADSSVQIILPSYEIIFPFIPGSTALHLAARYNHVDCVKELIQHGADLNAVDENGDTSLYIAVESCFNECALAHLSDLRNLHDKKFLSLPSSNSSNTPLHVAVENGMLDCIEKLVHLGSDVNYINKNGKSPLHIICSSKNLHDVELKLKILKLLIMDGNYSDMNNALNPIFLEYCDSESKAFLIAYGANIDLLHERMNVSLLEYELKFHKGSPKLLKYIMNCMPQLPFLHSLKLYPIADTLPKHNTVWHSSVLPKNVTFRLVRGLKNMYVEMSSVADEFEPEREHFMDTVFNQPLKKLILLQQPFLNILYDYINKELKDVNGKYDSIYRTLLRLPAISSYSSHQDNFRNEKLDDLRKHLWYQKMACIPRTLMHHCRFSIRKSMGPSNIRNINKLPLPAKLQSYLLFERDEVDWDF